MDRSGIERTNSDNTSECNVRSARSRSECSCPRILIVDDDSFNILALESMLSTLHIKMDYSIDGFKALEKLKEKYV